MRILGIDPGSLHLGLACVEKDGNRVHLVSAIVLSPPRSSAFYDRLRFLHDGLLAHVAASGASEVAIEGIFFSKNPRSAVQLGMARGVAIAACLAHRLSIHEYAPAQVKAAVTGQGRADKDQIRKMVELIVGARIDLRHDATDAVAVAICHASASRWERNARVSRRENSLQE